MSFEAGRLAYLQQYKAATVEASGLLLMVQVRLDGNLEVLFSDTVGFIQKLPTQLVAAFRATLEEIAAASVVLHVLDVSAPNAAAQCAAVLQVSCWAETESSVGHLCRTRLLCVLKGRFTSCCMVCFYDLTPQSQVGCSLLSSSERHKVLSPPPCRC